MSKMTNSERMKLHNPRLTCVDVWSKDIYQYDLDGNFIKRWEKRKDAKKFYNIKASLSHKGKKSVAGFIWKASYEGEKIAPRAVKEIERPVSVYNTSGEIVKTFESIKQCCAYLGCRDTSLIVALKCNKPWRGTHVRRGSEPLIEIPPASPKKRQVPLTPLEDIKALVGNFQVDDGAYYVYRHIRPDKNEVFYVGIGKKPTYKHSHKCLSTDYTRARTKYNRNKIWNNIVDKNQGKYEIEIILESDNYTFIKKKEIELIALYGRISTKTGTLANLTAGGDGVTELANRNIYATAKQVFVYDSYTGKYITEFKSSQDAAKHYGISGGRIRSSALGRPTLSSPYVFSYVYHGVEMDISSIVERRLVRVKHPKTKPLKVKLMSVPTSKVTQKLDLQGEVIEELPALREYERKYGFKSGHLCMCIKNKTKGYGFYWAYK